VEYDNVIKKIRVKMNHEVVDGFGFSAHLRYILGDFDEIPESHRKYTEILNATEEKNEYITSYPPDLRGGIQTMFIYSDIVKPTIIGDTMARILRTCPVQGKFGEVISKTFDRPHYVPISINSINSIEIHIKDHTDKLIKFAFGTVIIKLHFQRKRFYPY